MTLEKLPETIDPDLDLEKVKKECEELVNQQAKISAGAAIIPVPLLDVVVDTGMLSKLLPEISQRFGLIDEAINLNDSEAHTQQLKDRAWQFAGLMFTRSVVKKTIQGFGGRMVAKQVTKFIPFGGQLVSATMGYMIFRKIANDHIAECYEAAKKIQQNQHAKTVS